MNNKGMTLVELIVTFSLLLIIVVGLYNLILEVKFEMDEKQVAKDLTEYSSTMNNEIHYKLLKDKPHIILIKSNKNEDWNCNSRTSFETCNLSENSFTITNAKNESVQVAKTTLNEYCQEIYPCAIYYYGDNNNYRVIALNDINSNDESETNESLKQSGIYYNGIYEPIPDPEDSEIRNIVVVGDSNNDGEIETETPEDDRPYIKLENGLFIINFAFYMIDGDINYGFKIAYPFS